MDTVSRRQSEDSKNGTLGAQQEISVHLDGSKGKKGIHPCEAGG